MNVNMITITIIAIMVILAGGGGTWYLGTFLQRNFFLAGETGKIVLSVSAREEVMYLPVAVPYLGISVPARTCTVPATGSV